MDFSKFKNSNTLKIALIILLPTAIVGGYYGYKFVKNKLKDRKRKLNGEIDITGMTPYTIKIPFKYQEALFTNGEFFNAISKVNYSFISQGVENDNNGIPSFIYKNILMNIKDLQQIKTIIDKLGSRNEITIKETKPIDTKPIDIKPIDTKPIDIKNLDKSTPTKKIENRTTKS